MADARPRAGCAARSTLTLRELPMPLYEYSCPRCGRFSAFRPMAQHGEPQPCPQCGAVSERAISGVAMIGSGSSASRGTGLACGTGGRYRHMGGCACCTN